MKNTAVVRKYSCVTRFNLVAKAFIWAVRLGHILTRYITIYLNVWYFRLSATYPSEREYCILYY